MKRISTLIIICLTYSPLLWSQIGGISGSKLASYCVNVVDHKRLEFEPGVYSLNSGAFWDNNSNLLNYFQTPDSLITKCGMYIRLTYGLWNKLEFGVSIDSDLHNSSWGMRYVIFQKEKLGLAAISGINFPLANKLQNKNISLENTTRSFGGGLVATYNFNDRFSADLNYQYMIPFSLEQLNYGTQHISNIDLGYYMENKHFQLIGSLGYAYNAEENFTSEVLTLCYGFTIETDKFIFVFGFPHNIYGRNATKNKGLIVAVTLTF